MNVGKTKIVVGGEGMGEVEESGKWLCSVCKKGIGSNSVQCTRCLKWVHKRCSGVKGLLQTVTETFVCKQCIGGMAEAETVAVSAGMDTGSGDVLEYVEKFCYLGNMISADGGTDSAVVARVRTHGKCSGKFLLKSSLILKW